MTPLYVRLSADPNRRLAKAAAASGLSKRRLVEDAVREHISDEGLVVGHASPLSDGPMPEPPRAQTPEVLTLSEAASLLRVDEHDLEQAAQRGDVPGRRIGSQWRFSATALRAWLARDQGG